MRFPVRAPLTAVKQVNGKSTGSNRTPVGAARGRSVDACRRLARRAGEAVACLPNPATARSRGRIAISTRRLNCGSVKLASQGKRNNNHLTLNRDLMPWKGRGTSASALSNRAFPRRLSCFITTLRCHLFGIRKAIGSEWGEEGSRGKRRIDALGTTSTLTPFHAEEVRLALPAVVGVG